MSTRAAIIMVVRGTEHMMTNDDRRRGRTGLKDETIDDVIKQLLQRENHKDDWETTFNWIHLQQRLKWHGIQENLLCHIHADI